MFQVFYLSEHVTFDANIFLKRVKERMTITALVRNIQFKKSLLKSMHTRLKNYDDCRMFPCVHVIIIYA